MIQMHVRVGHSSRMGAGGGWAAQACYRVRHATRVGTPPSSWLHRLFHSSPQAAQNAAMIYAETKRLSCVPSTALTCRACRTHRRLGRCALADCRPLPVPAQRRRRLLRTHGRRCEKDVPEYFLMQSKTLVRSAQLAYIPHASLRRSQANLSSLLARQETTGNRASCTKRSSPSSTCLRPRRRRGSDRDNRSP